MKRVSGRTHGFDHLLSAVCAILAGWSSGMSIGLSEVAWLFAGLATGGALIGFLCGRFLPDRVASQCGWVYTGLALACVFFARDLNGLLPGEGFPLQILAAGVLSWVVSLGTLATWRDSTLTFQMVPCIAIFGLVGAFDVYAAAPAMFFIFIICAAALFFRAHYREMVRQAGSALNPGAADPLSRAEVTERAVNSGAWRWMAGPEWAVASALIIVAASVFGAPAIRQSVQGVTEAVRVPLNNPTQSQGGGTSFTASADVQVGQGPTTQRNIPVLKAKFSGTTYLRSETYDGFTGRGWRDDFITSWPEVPSIDQVAPKGTDRPFEIRYVGGQHDRVYIPGEVVQVDLAFFLIAPLADRSIRFREPVRSELTVTGSSRILPSLDGTELPGKPPYGWQSSRYLNADRASDRFRKWVQESTDHVQAPAEKAEALRAAISVQADYNLRAPAIPRNRDLIDTFIFGTRQGYCDLYATAMTVGARTLGIPARIGVGFLLRDPRRDEEGYFTIRDSDYHMWSELYFEGVGWVVFDATSGSRDVTPTEGEVSESALPEWAFASVAGVIAAGIAILGIPRALRAVRAIMGRIPIRSDLDRLYLSLDRALFRKTGKPRRFHETGSDYLGRILGESHPAYAGLLAIYQSLESDFFSPDGPSKERLQDHRAKIREAATLELQPNGRR